MQISSLFIRIVFLVFPGILGSKLYRKLRGKMPRKTWEDFVEILLFAVASYMIYGILEPIFVCKEQSNNPALDHFGFRPFLDEKIPVDPWRIFWSSFIAVGLAALASYAHHHKWISGFAQRTGLSNRFGDEDVWEFFHDMPDVNWVFVRDHKLDLVYYGFVRAFSESEKDRELILCEVDVYTNTKPATKLYSTKTLYLSRDKYDLSIEFPDRHDHNKDKGINSQEYDNE